ncbi:MAG: ABC transporter permease [Planctomycetes bacterium]|jgi:peptide/nickel transport system permease protein|nr:ABC transporter permease [Planctomycetota bacterium]
MLIYIIRRLMWAALTIFGVMVLTFLLFRVSAGDIAGAVLGEKAAEAQKATWRHKFGYDLPWLINVHRNLLIISKVGGDKPLWAKDTGSSRARQGWSLVLDAPPGENYPPNTVLMSGYIRGLDESTSIHALGSGGPSATNEDPTGSISFGLGDGSTLDVPVDGVKTIGDLMQRINGHAANNGRLEARITSLSVAGAFNSQFFRHLKTSLLFEGESLKHSGQSLKSIIAKHGKYSLAVQIPAVAIQWFIGMILALFVAYYRGRWPDKIGVFMSVLGMCVPFLAFMIYGQALMFHLGLPQHAAGTIYRGNLYVPVAIMVIASLGGHVRFYRTIILDETGRDYVRTAQAKGLPLTTILFKHVLKNCMLPILTSLILAIPFLIMGSLLVENFFGIPGLGDRMITSINDRDEPIMNGLVFLTAVIYTAGILLTDLCYAVFDPRIRLK